MKSVLNTQTMVQVGYVVKDIEATKRKYAEFFGVEVPETILANGGPEKFEITKTNYNGADAPEADAKLAFFDVGGVMAIELIEPNEKASVWRDYLDEHGESIHHVAFVVDSIEKRAADCEKFGLKVVQTGNFAAGDGKYAYIDAQDSLKTCIELLERW